MWLPSVSYRKLGALATGAGLGSCDHCYFFTRAVDKTDHANSRTFYVDDPQRSRRQKQIWLVLYRETGFVYMLSLLGRFGLQSFL